MKKILLFLLVFLINTVFSLCAFAENFYITDYYINLDVKENRDVVITEDIGVYFTSHSHGIYRTIPTRTYMFYEKGEKKLLKAKISDIQVSESYTIQPSMMSTIIKIGDPVAYVYGPKHYKIKYTYSLGVDPLKDQDEFYFNIIGTQWNTSINNVKFKITLPKPYEELNKTTGFSMGVFSNRGYDPNYLKYVISNNHIILGKVTRKLEPNEALTVRISLPENYFSKNKYSDEKNYIITLMTILTLIAFLMWLFFGKDEKVIPVVNFYPPKNRNSAEVGVEYRGKASQKEIVSLIMYLANKGYIEIEDDGVSFTLHKLREYDGKNSCERRLMSAIFKNSDIATAEDLQFSKSFYRNCEGIIKSLNNIKKFIFDKSANSPAKLSILLICILGLFISMIYTIGDYSFVIFHQVESYILLFPLFGSIALFSILYEILTSNEYSILKIQKSVALTVWGIMFIGAPLTFFMQNLGGIITDKIPVLLYGIVCIVISFVCLLNMPKRNKKGRLLLGQIEGFKKFLEVAEKRRIEALIAENKNYASDILPFAYVLDISDKIIPVLESISLYTQPTWYKGEMSNYTFSLFTSSMEKATVPSYENGGITRSSGGISGRGFSGGGSSGGGGGGGGGGSW